MSARERRKGSRGENELAAIFSDHIGPTKRQLGQARDSGTDIHRGKWRIEVKRRKRIALLYEALQQAELVDSYPAVAIRADGKDWLVCVRLMDFIRCAREELI